MMLSNERVVPSVEVDGEATAGRLFDAYVSHTAIQPVTPTLGDDQSIAYDVQERLIARRLQGGARRIGRKVGLTALAVQSQLGVDQPDFGVLLSDMMIDEDDQIPLERLIAPRIEAEIAFVLSADVNDVSRAAVVAAVAYVVPAFEIVDSRIADWKIGIIDTISDNASSAYFVLGKKRALLRDFAPASAEMVLTKDDIEVSAGTGAACLGDPINALVWVAETAARLGRPLRAGEIVLSGALGPMVPLDPNAKYRAEIAGLGSVSVTASSSGKSKS
jgi:2-oxopent-4-enoate hydratase